MRTSNPTIGTASWPNGIPTETTNGPRTPAARIRITATIWTWTRRQEISRFPACITTQLGSATANYRRPDPMMHSWLIFHPPAVGIG